MKKTLNKVFAFCMAIAMCMCICLSVPAFAMEEASRETIVVKKDNEVDFLGNDGKPLEQSYSTTIKLTKDCTKVGYRVLPHPDYPSGYSISLNIYKSTYFTNRVTANGKYGEIDVSGRGFKKGDTITVSYGARDVELSSIIVIFG